MLVTRLVSCALLAALPACVGHPPRVMDVSESDELPAATRMQTDVITEQEITRANVGDIDVLSAIKRLRPNFLVNRGPVSLRTPTAGRVQTSIDGAALSAVGNLSAIRTTEVREIRYLSPTDAAQRFGTNAASGAVIVVMRK